MRSMSVYLHQGDGERGTFPLYIKGYSLYKYIQDTVLSLWSMYMYFT